MVSQGSEAEATHVRRGTDLKNLTDPPTASRDQLLGVQRGRIDFDDEGAIVGGIGIVFDIGGEPGSQKNALRQRQHRGQVRSDALFRSEPRRFGGQRKWP